MYRVLGYLFQDLQKQGVTTSTPAPSRLFLRIRQAAHPKVALLDSRCCYSAMYRSVGTDADYEPDEIGEDVERVSFPIDR